MSVCRCCVTGALRAQHYEMRFEEDQLCKAAHVAEEAQLKYTTALLVWLL